MFNFVFILDKSVVLNCNFCYEDNVFLMILSVLCGVYLLYELVLRFWILFILRLVKLEFISNFLSGLYSNGKVVFFLILKGSERKIDDMVLERGFKEMFVIILEGWFIEEIDWKDRLWIEIEGELDGNKRLKVLEFVLFGGDDVVFIFGILILLW